MADVVITEFMDAAAVADLSSDFDVHYDPDLVDHRPELLGALADARGLIVRNRTQVDAPLLEAAPLLKVVGRLGVGLDNIDLDACRARGVTVHPATGANAAAVAEYVVAATLVLRRGIFSSRDAVEAGEWPRTALVGAETGGATLGLVGFGDIARQVARLAAGLGMQVQAQDPFVLADDPVWRGITRHESLERLLATSDVVSLHVPLLPETAHLIDASALATMRQGTILVNTSRGGIVDEAALVDALRSGHLGGAALDVFAHEPVDAAQGARFAGVPNLILTPHIAGITHESNTRVGAITAANVRRALEEPT